MNNNISIITLTEAFPNRVEFFPDLVNSLNSQKDVNIHWLVSAPNIDAFKTLIKGSCFSTEFIPYVKGDNLGKRRNSLIENVQTDFVMNIDDDDFLLHNHALINAIEELRNNPHVSASIGRIITKLPDNTYETWNESPVRGKPSYQLPQGIYGRKDLIEKITIDKIIPVYSGAAVYRNDDNLKWSESLDVYEDLYALLSGINDNFIMSHDVRYVYRNHNENTMLSFTDDEKNNDLNTILKHFNG